MPDGKEEREEQKQRLEQQKLQDLEDRLDQTDPDDWQPERPDSLALPPILPIRHPAMKPQNRIHPILRHKLPALPRILRLNPQIQTLHLSPQTIHLQPVPKPGRTVIFTRRKISNQTHNQYLPDPQPKPAPKTSRQGSHKHTYLKPHQHRSPTKNKSKTLVTETCVLLETRLLNLCSPRRVRNVSQALPPALTCLRKPRVSVIMPQSGMAALIESIPLAQDAHGVYFI